MLILAIDTSGPSGGITLSQADGKSFRVLQSSAIAGGTFSAQLIPTLAASLKKHGYRAQDIGGFAAASGPGSFTGLRVGLSAIKGLAETLHKPIATVSVLEALASLCSHDGKIAAALDAGRKEVFLGVYRKSGQQLTHAREELLTQEKFLAVMNRGADARAVTCDAPIVELAKAANMPIDAVPRPTSEDIARIGAAKLFANETVSVEALDANYLRRSDAEIFSKGNG